MGVGEEAYLMTALSFVFLQTCEIFKTDHLQARFPLNMLFVFSRGTAPSLNGTCTKPSLLLRKTCQMKRNKVIFRLSNEFLNCAKSTMKKSTTVASEQQPDCQLKLKIMASICNICAMNGPTTTPRAQPASYIFGSPQNRCVNDAQGRQHQKVNPRFVPSLKRSMQQME